MKQVTKIILCVCITATAMAFLESAVVIYLRDIYYKDGFNFPLRPMPLFIAGVEIIREAATIIMLVGIGYLAGKNKLGRFAHFILAFAVWDLFYYVFLYLFLHWPQSLSTPDILFLIPLPWVGPVWAPCLLCVLMSAGSLHVILRIDKNNLSPVRAAEWFLLFGGAGICIFSFMLDFIVSCINKGSGVLASQQSLFSEVHRYIPGSFNYLLFLTGFSLMSYPVITRLLLTKKTSTNEKE